MDKGFPALSTNLGSCLYPGIRCIAAALKRTDKGASVATHFLERSIIFLLSKLISLNLIE